MRYQSDLAFVESSRNLSSHSFTQWLRHFVKVICPRAQKLDLKPTKSIPLLQPACTP